MHALVQSLTCRHAGTHAIVQTHTSMWASMHIHTHTHTHIHTYTQGYKHKRAYIIAEGPMESTARNFWKVVSDRKCGVIVMCSDFVENGEVGT